MLIENRLLRAAAHFASPDQFNDRPLCHAVWIHQKDGMIHIAATDGYMAAHFQWPTDDETEIARIGIESKILLDRRLRRRQDLDISSDGNAVTMIGPDGQPFMEQHKIRRQKKPLETTPLDVAARDDIGEMDVAEFVDSHLKPPARTHTTTALDQERPEAALSVYAMRKIGLAFDELHDKNDKSLGYTFRLSAANKPVIIDIENNRDYYGDWQNLRATFVIMPVNPGRQDPRLTQPKAGIARFGSQWHITLTGEHRIRTHSSFDSYDEAAAAFESLICANLTLDLAPSFEVWQEIRNQFCALDVMGDMDDKPEIAAKFDEAETANRAALAQSRLDRARAALDTAQAEVDAASAAVLASAEVADEPEPPRDEFADAIVDGLKAHGYHERISVRSVTV